MGILTSDADNIRFNGTGRCFFQEKMGTATWGALLEVGELENFNLSQTVTTTPMESNRTAARGTLLEVVDSTESTLTFGLREMTMRNLRMALLGGTVNTSTQTKSFFDGITKTWVDDGFLDFEKFSLRITKIPGTIVGTISQDDTVTGVDSTETGKVAYVAADHIILVNVSGAFQVGEKIEVDASNYITASGVLTLEDVCITDSTGATRRVQNTDYEIDPDAGFVAKLASGSIADTDKVYADYGTFTIETIHALAGSKIEGRFIFITDADDRGPRFKVSFHNVSLALDGDFPLIGDGAAIMNVTGSVLLDDTRPSGEQYYEIQKITS